MLSSKWDIYIILLLPKGQGSLEKRQKEHKKKGNIWLWGNDVFLTQGNCTNELTEVLTACTQDLCKKFKLEPDQFHHGEGKSAWSLTPSSGAVGSCWLLRGGDQLLIKTGGLKNLIDFHASGRSHIQKYVTAQTGLAELKRRKCKTWRVGIVGGILEELGGEDQYDQIILQRTKPWHNKN